MGDAAEDFDIYEDTGEVQLRLFSKMKSQGAQMGAKPPSRSQTPYAGHSSDESSDGGDSGEDDQPRATPGQGVKPATVSFAKIANAAIDRGFSVIPLLPKSKNPCGHLAANGAKSRTRNRDLVAAWAEQLPNANVGICSDDEITILESDDEARFRELVRDVSERLFGEARELPRTLTSQARTNRPHWFYRNTARTRAHQDSPGAAGLYEWRHSNQYVVGFGSIHPLGMPYEIVVDIDIAPMPDWLVTVLDEIKGAYRGTSNAASNFVKVGPAGVAIEALKSKYLLDAEKMLADADFVLEVTAGERHYFLNSIAGLIHDGDRSVDEIFDLLCLFRDQYCEGADEKGDEEVRRIAEWVIKKQPCIPNLDDLLPDVGYSIGLHWFATKELFDAHVATLPVVEQQTQRATVGEYGSLQTYTELKRKRQNAKPYLVEDICRRGQIVMMVGNSTLGKSAMANQLAWAVATGRPFLGKATQQAPALIVDIENSAEQQLEFAECFRKKFGQPEFPESILLPESVFTDAAGRQQIEHFIANSGAEIVIIDSLKSFQSGAEEAGKESNLFMQWARKITTKHDCAMVLIRHLRKPSADAKAAAPWLGDDQVPVVTWMNGASGAQGLINMADVRWGVDEAHDERECFVMRLNERTVGDSGVMRIIREYDEEGKEAGYSLRHGLSLLTDGQVEKYIALPDEFHFMDACAACGGAKSVASRLINRAKQAGALKQIGRGRYEKTRTPDADEVETRVKKDNDSVF